ncbi:MAG: hypothetical protein COZ06_25755 [Armatimonadetes bacterium CG_4_10_14_3_um_filter_66_18]|nr:hypothetical protein [Armatimonadota bacterium]NCP30484.1 hypothetical protein [Armatimonadota bacterium]OIP10474.1 MAG: hypothetical protein AUJ96_03785 [Armatimonadetes bacterium CG2_30_66_41]PIY42163.1 MAG: hypothetical protein COZ06_25755 [Armatimonadetes bacterium CG_4_10_14_3_um_filter_66_18]PIZ50874.1 MAG: hypothetical protein COY42_00915 [Armatimonadetes bacterium CG_4_10_14_0_8_um_filter_66_14]
MPRAPAALFLALCAVSPKSLSAQGRGQLPSLGYPRAFFFRAAEAVGPRVQTGNYTYDRWDSTFSRLGGIMGKTLEEEVPGRSANIPFFTRFKQDHPDQLVLLHYNGNSRDPRDAGPEFFAGHWVYFTGCGLTKDLSDESDQSDLSIEDPTLFATNMGRYRDRNVDLAICALDDGGRPNWRVAEQLELVAVDVQKKTLRVKRGAFGTKPLAFAAGKAHVAPHATEGPWGKKSNLLWYYNFSTACPRDAKGRNCIDGLVEDFGNRFLPGGALAAYDGVEFDVMHHDFGPPRVGGHGLDLDADGQADWGYVDGVNTYGLGVIEFCRRLREKLGDGRVLQADGGNANSQRAMKWLNGIESEGWPHLSDWALNDWSGGMNRHRYWQQFAREPKFNYINHKYVTHGDEPGVEKQPEVPFATHRAVFAAAQCFDAVLTYSYPPPKEPGEDYSLWDELIQGVAKKPGWLGQPLAEAVNLAKRKPDLLKGEGTTMTPAFVTRWAGEDLEVVKDGKALKVAATAPGAQKLRFRLAGVPTAGADLTVFLRMRAEPLKGSTDVPRLAWVGLAPDQGLLIQPDPPTAGFCLRGKQEQPLDAGSGAGVVYFPARKVGDATHAAYLCHPPWKGGVGYTFWERTVEVPQQGRLTFATCLSDKAETRSDGVTYKVLLKTADADYRPVFDEHLKEWRWLEHSVSLAHWAGKRVTLKFVTDCGPNDNATTDHSGWGDVRIVSDKPDFRVTEPIRHRTFVGPESFESSFYFRAVQTPTVDLAFDLEGARAVWIESLTAHAAPEALCREFEHGLVLCNPANHDCQLDLREIAPGQRFQRLQAQSKQDTQTNNGQPVGDEVTLGARDGLFLVRELQ